MYFKNLFSIVVFLVFLFTITTNYVLAAENQIYENLQGGFLLEYPNDWEAIDLEDPLIKAMIVPAITNPDDPLEAISMIMIEPLAFQIDLFDYSEISIENLETSLENFNLIEEMESSLGGVPAKKIKFTGLNEYGIPVTGTSVWTIKDNKAFLILSMAESAKYTEYSKSSRMIEDSFKFMDEPPKVIRGEYSNTELGLEAVFPPGWTAIEFTSESVQAVGKTKMIMSEPTLFSQTGNFDDFVSMGIFSINLSEIDFAEMSQSIEQSGCKMPSSASIVEINSMKAMEMEMDCIVPGAGIAYGGLAHSFLTDKDQIYTMFTFGSEDIRDKEISKYEQFLKSLKIKKTLDISIPSEFAAPYDSSITTEKLSLGNFEEDVIIGSRTPINNFSFDENLGEISFEIMNPQQDYNSISIYPGKILSPPYTVMVDGKIHDDVLIVDDITTGDTIVSFALDSPIRKVSLKGTLDNSLFKTEDGKSQPIPDWIRNNADWWAQGAIGDSDFVSGIQYLIKEEIMIIPQTAKVEGGGSKEIPSWIKNNADWWAQGLISDDDFLKGIQYLVEQGIIQV